MILMMRGATCGTIGNSKWWCRDRCLSVHLGEPRLPAGNSRMLRIICLERSTEKGGIIEHDDDTYAGKGHPWGPLGGFCVNLSRRFAGLSCPTSTDGASGEAIFPGPSDRPLYLLPDDCRVFRRLFLSAAFGPTRPAFRRCYVRINR